MNKKPSYKDLKDWKDFLESKEKIHNKDNVTNEIKFKKEASIDLHGFSLDQANSRVEKFITDCFKKKVLKLNIITGKGLRSKVDQNPYQSKDLGILKYSVPEFIKSNTELMKIIKKIDDQVDNKNSGFFSIFLKL
ncbi:Smr/MutS family protein [Candidatus Pelagibacter sp.]|nr:Smr/MutS family protein [Candidatus Pelagibacter sp.]